MDNVTTIKFCIFDENVNKIVIGSEGHGRSILELLKERHVLNNNYRKQHGMALVRKGHAVYKIRKSYKKSINR